MKLFFKIKNVLVSLWHTILRMLVKNKRSTQHLYLQDVDHDNYEELVIDFNGNRSDESIDPKKNISSKEN